MTSLFFALAVPTKVNRGIPEFWVWGLNALFLAPFRKGYGKRRKEKKARGQALESFQFLAGGASEGIGRQAG